jgi:hypothetical protein
MLASVEPLRNNAVREIDRHRDALGGGLRRSIEEIEGEFQDVGPGGITEVPPIRGISQVRRQVD